MEKTTKECPYCGKEIFAVAKKCRYCGKWLATDGTDTTPELTESEDKGRQPTNESTSDGAGKTVPYYIPLAFFFVFVAVIIFAMNKSCSSNNSEESVSMESTYDYNSYNYNSDVYNYVSAQLPAKMRLTGTVNYDYGRDETKTVHCYLDLKLNQGQVSGCTNYSTDFNGQPSEVIGTYKSRGNGIYYFDVFIPDNAGRDFEGTYDTRTGIFSGQFSGRGMNTTYPFKFTLSK